MSWIFGSESSPIDDLIEKATAEHMTTENWALIIDICDRIKAEPKMTRAVLTTIKRRLNNRDPHVVLLALALLDSCWCNCEQPFRHFEAVTPDGYISHCFGLQSVRQVGEKTRLVVQKWAENECKNDDSLALVKTLYKNLQADGLSFESSERKRTTIPYSNDPDVVTSQEEEDAIARAIALSLNDAPENGRATINGNSSLYPSASSYNHNRASKKRKSNERLQRILEEDDTLYEYEGNRVFNAISNGVPSKAQNARALYDFEAAEENEISFRAGDTIRVTDDSNPNWWRGRNERTKESEGLFPSSFVTTNMAQFEDEMKKQCGPASPAVVEAPAVVIDEQQLLRCIALLEDCDPTGRVADPAELEVIEASSLAQGALIDRQLTSVDKQSNALAQVDMAIRDVLALYDGAIQQVPYQNRAVAYSNAPLGYPTGAVYAPASGSGNFPVMPQATIVQQSPGQNYQLQQQLAGMQQQPSQRHAASLEWQHHYQPQRPSVMMQPTAAAEMRPAASAATMPPSSPHPSLYQQPPAVQTQQPHHVHVPQQY